ncbi:hypothetical protein AQUCO_02800254v1 [Aquilegia coerulea]|uniref:Uncharacterized protein n=1 Tax=Aquilegia coerulea TaxID=218851 RepID=A0A2G5D4H5_AQUCA|nr:hypothetical protein AQUCO_02800254v1 [Aquilegia coerulea]
MTSHTTQSILQLSAGQCDWCYVGFPAHKQSFSSNVSYVIKIEARDNHLKCVTYFGLSFILILKQYIYISSFSSSEFETNQMLMRCF